MTKKLTAEEFIQKARIEPDIKEMFLSNKVDKYYSHPCYQYEKDIENLSKDVEQLYVQ